MSSNPSGSGRPNALASLRRYIRPKAAPERCQMCSVGLAAEHRHLVETASGRMACACDACALLFCGEGERKFRRVPRRVQFLEDFRLTESTWGALQLPINLAFFVQSTRAGRTVALYPSPAGATEATVASEAWEALADDNPVLREFEPDVEALLMNWTGKTCECYRVGVDKCYQLVGLIRMHWRGLSGGTEVWREITEFFAGLQSQSGPQGKTFHA